ncbi:hypothetical protein CSA56_11265 [candidate division KSB3 bacterium]|uniref:Uncharacterized protein n=1 Tax=candidate division KSB3 bacterium TaxID=2044937 RepID=A0A2G6KCU5_9BACT|nr:MAG: hypothetical protein CSA56_11265 [candidate division KSB3 bacterium]
MFDTKEPIGFWGKWKTPAYRNLFVMMPIVSMLLSAVLGGTVALVSAWKFDVPIDWNRWLDGGMLGIALGMTIGMAFGMVGRVMGGVASGTMVGTVYGVTAGVVGGVSLSVALGVTFENVVDVVITVGAIFGVLGGMAFTLDLEIGIALSIAFAVVAVLSFGGEFMLQKLLGVRFGALLARGMMSGAFVLGALRAMLYPLQCVLAVSGLVKPALHPIFWDDLSILPLPFTRSVLLRQIRQDEAKGLRILKETGRNLFRRTGVKAVLYKYVHKHPRPLRFLYGVLNTPTMQEYLLLPVSAQSWDQYVSVQHVFLGELALRPVEAMKHPRFRRSSWWLNLYNQKETSLTKFAGMLYDLLDEQTIGQKDFSLNDYEIIYQKLSSYPAGKEIIRSYNAMAAFLSYQDLSAFAQAEQVSADIAGCVFFDEALRPAVMRSLMRLGHIGRDMAHYFGTADRQEQLDALAHATGALNEIDAYVSVEVMLPERFVMQRIISQWQHLILEAIGNLGQSGSKIVS